MTDKACTHCQQESLIAFINDSNKAFVFHGLLIKPGERICPKCAEEKGCTLFDNYENKSLENEKK